MLALYAKAFAMLALYACASGLIWIQWSCTKCRLYVCPKLLLDVINSTKCLQLGYISVDRGSFGRPSENSWETFQLIVCVALRQNCERRLKIPQLHGKHSTKVLHSFEFLAHNAIKCRLIHNYFYGIL